MTACPDCNIGVVVIGRNEGQRLSGCLRSLAGVNGTLVYVDSGSTDGSPEYAGSLGCRVVELDRSRPFSAARARNEGFAYLLKHDPNVSFVQFLDGDCEMAHDWLQAGAAMLSHREDTGIVRGHLRELYPQATIYNKLFDLEWRQIPGEIRATGGIFMVRSEAFRAAGGFRPDVIAAEDDEFCVRIRRLGYKILQVDAEMGRHDIAMTRFSEWWRRARRTGHAFAQVSALHGRGDERYFVRDYWRILLWALALPLLALCLAPFTHALSLVVLLLLYLLQFIRTFHVQTKRGWSAGDASIYSLFTMLFKFPALCGLLEYHWRHWRRRDFTIIEYKRSI